MSAIYDNWERLVAAVLKKQQLWELFHDQSRSPSILSRASDLTSSSRSLLDDVSLDIPSTSYSLPKLVFFSNFTPALDVRDIHLDAAEVLGHGTFGTAYAAILGDGSRIVVKRLNSAGISENDFNRHMAIVGGVRHENVAALRAYYSSGDERLMLYDYFSRGSVYDLLHGRPGGYRPDVGWESRLRIAIGAARGIYEIHKHGNLAHGNIKSSNVFHDLDQYGWVSDLGPTNLIETTFPSTAHCYAPELKSSKNVSQASDVYSFGVLLLELLTRKPSVYVVHGGPLAVDLVKLVTSVMSRVRAANVFDADLLKDPTLKEQMVKMLQIGIKCVAKSIKKRPKMSEVVKMLEGITALHPRTPSPRRLVFIKDTDPSFEIEDLLRGSAEVLGKGTFGTSYKTTLENGNKVMVKRLKDVILTLEDFQHQMEVIGRMRHENVAELRAYYFSEDEKLLVYDYFDRDLSFMIHGRRGAAWTPLDWKTRLKVAVGAARGIAHIHKQDGQKFVHGNIMSRNILLGVQNYGIVSHAGLAKLTSSIRLSPSRILESYAPEVTRTRGVTQASDVYSFGLVLLELLSGKPTLVTGDDGEATPLVEWVQSVDRGEWMNKVLDSGLVRSEVEEETMLQIMLIAMDCVSISSEHRPKMLQVVGRLEEISGIEPLHELSLEDAWGQPLSIQSRKKNYGIISDVGLAKLMNPVGQTSLLTPGYLAPEVTETKRASQASDTYSFGALLFELLSGKPSQTTTDDDNVICLVESFKNLDRDEWADRIIDSELPRDGNVVEMMIQLLQIAMDCVSDYPERRPKMSQVVRMLEEYSGVESSEVPILEETWEKPLSIESRLEDLLEDLLPTLTPYIVVSCDSWDGFVFHVEIMNTFVVV